MTAGRARYRDNRPGHYLQPHEGVAGADRAGDPVLEADLPVGDLVATLGFHLARAVLVPQSPKQEALAARINNPVAGDLVVVRDSIHHPDPLTRHRGVGYLVEHRVEWATSDDQWRSDQDDDASLVGTDRVIEWDAFYIQYGPAPADVCRWVNCDVLALPTFGQRWG